MIYGLEGLRGVAALLVALFHGWGCLLTDNSFVKGAWLSVDLFFVISGFVMSHVYRKTDDFHVAGFLLKRAGRLYPLHVVMLFLFLASEYFLQLLKAAAVFVGNGVGQGGARFDLFDPASFFANLLLVQTVFPVARNYNAPAWSISAEIFAYLVFSMVTFFSLRRPKTIFVLISLSISLTSFCFLITNFADLSTHDGLGALLRCFSGFFLGAILPDIVQMSAGKRFYRDVVQIVFLAFSASIFIFSKEIGWVTFLAPLVFSILVWSIASDSGVLVGVLKAKWIQFLGKISYSIYMVHFTLLVFFNPLGAILAEPGRSIVKLIYIALLLGVSFFTYQYIELPWRNRVRNFAEKKFGLL